jgi:prepilin-type N-terminal cleavage/methylation domain-containing protein
MRRINKNSGFTLIEVVLIIVIMGIIATVAMKTMEPAMDQSRIDATLREMEIMSQAIIGNKNLISDGIRSDFGYVGDVGALPPNLDALVSNPGSYATWRGPYIMSDFLENPDDYKEDAWGNSYNYSDVIITSPGNGSPITRRFAESVDELLSNTVNGSIYDGLNAVPGDSARWRRRHHIGRNLPFRLRAIFIFQYDSHREPFDSRRLFILGGYNLCPRRIQPLSILPSCRAATYSVS